MIIAGLTGSIGMGKSTTASLFAEQGIPIWDADAAVHRLYGCDGAAVGPVGGSFPAVVVDGAIDRERLGAIVLADPEAIRRLESIVHPLVGQDRQTFLDRERAARSPVVILDIPLLFEGGGNKHMDAVIVVSAPPEVQRERVLARPGMTPEKFEAILKRQTPDADKRAGADFVIDSSQGIDHAREQVKTVVKALRERAARQEKS